MVAIDEDPHAEGFAAADRALNLPLTDALRVFEALTEMQVDFLGVVSFVSDAGNPLAAAIREHFGLPGVGLEICRRLANKALQRRLWKSFGVPSPRFQVFETCGAAIAGIAQFGFPLIVKPADSSGSRGVTKLESSDEDVEDAVERALQLSKSSEVIVETYMTGPEFTVESFSISGAHHILAVTEKQKVEGTRGTVARELATPDRPADVIKQITDAVQSAYSALDYQDGPGHAEVILMDNGTVGLVEVAGRGGGFNVFDRLVPAVSGINVARLTVMQAVGLKVDISPSQGRAAVLRFISSRPGKLAAVHGLESANKLDGVEAGAIAAIGDSFESAATDGDRLGWILAQANTPEAAQHLANQAESLISFEVVL